VSFIFSCYSRQRPLPSLYLRSPRLHILWTLAIAMDSIAGSRMFSLGSARFSSLHLTIFLVAIFVALFVGLTISAGLASAKGFCDSKLVSYSKFFYASFLKPHQSSSDGNQQSALESFYETQVLGRNPAPFSSGTEAPDRQQFTMLPGRDSFEAVKTCSG
jgi:hypothetical protein